MTCRRDSCGFAGGDEHDLNRFGDNRAVWNVDKRAILDSCGIEGVERAHAEIGKLPQISLNVLAIGCQIAIDHGGERAHANLGRQSLHP